MLNSGLVIHHGHSVNNRIASELCFLSYAPVYDAVNLLLEFGKGKNLVIVDLKDAYHIVLIHLSDQNLLAIL